MTWTGRTGGRRVDCGGWADGRMGGRGGGRVGGLADWRTGADWQTGGTGGGRADCVRTGRRMGGQVGGLPNEQTGADGRTGWRTGGRGWTGGRWISEGKTPNLTRHLTWAVGNPTWPSSV